MAGPVTQDLHLAMGAERIVTFAVLVTRAVLGSPTYP